MNLRGHLCWLLGHRYHAIWFKPPDYITRLSDYQKGEQAGVPDTEAGCIYCGHTEPNKFPMCVEDIDWEATKHRLKPPEHNTYRRGINAEE